MGISRQGCQNILQVACLIYLLSVITFTLGDNSTANQNSTDIVKSGNKTEEDNEKKLEFQRKVSNLTDIFLKEYNETKLRRRKAHRVNYERPIDLVPGITHMVKTLSMKPPIFEIRKFLNDSECDHLINLANDTKLESSLTQGEADMQYLEYLTKPPASEFKDWDTDENGKIDPKEASNAIEKAMNLKVDADDVLKVLQYLLIDFNHDGYVSFDEFHRKNTSRLHDHILKLKDEMPHIKYRHSQQTWLRMRGNKDPVIQQIRQRLERITGLPMPLIEASEPLQVVKYEPGGHYNCHMDTMETNFPEPCCHLEDMEGIPDNRTEEEIKNGKCRFCRFMTILYFLNDVELGGETAFPVADNETFNETLWDEDKKGLCDLARNCKKSNIVVKPEKGKAILWYSHFVYRKTGWGGRMDSMAHHGGCDVAKGTKWIANNWLNAGINKTLDIMHWAYKKVRTEMGMDNDWEEDNSAENNKEDSKYVGEEDNKDYEEETNNDPVDKKHEAHKPLIVQQTQSGHIEL